MLKIVGRLNIQWIVVKTSGPLGATHAVGQSKPPSRIYKDFLASRLNIILISKILLSGLENLFNTELVGFFLQTYSSDLLKR